MDRKEMKEKTEEALTNWILRVTDEKGLATSEEIAALPEIAKTLLDYLSSPSPRSFTSPGTFNVPECNPGDLIKETLSEGKPIANVNRIIKTEDIPCDNSGNLIFTPIDNAYLKENIGGE